MSQASIGLHLPVTFTLFSEKVATVVDLDAFIIGTVSTSSSACFYDRNISQEEIMGRAVLLWLLGVPVSVIILLALFWH